MSKPRKNADECLLRPTDWQSYALSQLVWTDEMRIDLVPCADNQPDGFKSEDADAIKEQGGSA